MAAPRRGNKVKVHFLSNCELPTLLEPDRSSGFTASKVVVTIGPACQDVDTLCKLLEAGTSCARIDLTWGSLDFHRRSLENINEAMRRTRKLCAIMVDTVGRELYIKRDIELDEQGWPLHDDSGVSVEGGSQVTVTTRDVEPSSSLLPISYKTFPKMVQKGDTLFIGRYLVTGSEESSLWLEVEEVTDTDVLCIAQNNAVLDGLLTVFHVERSSDSLSNQQNDLPILADPDTAALRALAPAYEIDFVSLSFTRSEEDVRAARKFLDELGMGSTQILAKLETRQSLLNFRAIALEADGVIMSRGNLGLDVQPEKMALLQKSMVANCNILGKPILITRVVDTMVRTPRPTRAEATDVANAVLDGVDGILLGAETLRGKYPVATVETILHICKSAEKVFDHVNHFEHLMQEAMVDDDFEVADLPAVAGSGSGSFSSELPPTPAPRPLGAGPLPPRTSAYLNKLESIASSAVRAADSVKASLIIVYTQTGKTAALVSKYRPPMPILTLVIPHLKSDRLTWRLEGRSAARQCQICRSLLPVLAAPSPSGETLLEEAVLMAGRAGLVGPNDHVVVVQRAGDDFVIKVVSLDEIGTGIKQIRPRSLVDLIKATAGVEDDDEDDDGFPPESPLGGNTIGGESNPLVPAVPSAMRRGAYLRTLSTMNDSRLRALGSALSAVASGTLPAAAAALPPGLPNGLPPAPRSK